jgi:hypothetical protein
VALDRLILHSSGHLHEDPTARDLAMGGGVLIAVVVAAAAQAVCGVGAGADQWS